MHTADELAEARRLFANGVSKRQIANELGLAYRTVRDWLGPQPPAWTLDPPRSDCPRCELWHRAELFDDQYSYLLGQYLGDGSIATQRNGVHRLVISTTEAYPGISHETATALSYVRGALAHEYVGGSPGVTLVSAYSKHWPCVFPQHGPGMKHTRPIKLEPWQAAIVERNPEAFVRGLIHSDGCRWINGVNTRGKHYEYVRYGFSNRSQDIHALFRWGCDLLGVEWRAGGRYQTYVSRRDSVAVIETFVGAKR